MSEYLILLKEAIRGDEIALQQLFDLFERHDFLLSDGQAIHAYLKLSSEKEVGAIYLRGLLFLYGFGVDKDVDMAFLLMREAAAKGEGRAIYQVGHFYFVGVGVDQNIEIALQWLKRAAESPHYVTEAMYDLGVLLAERDAREAQEWLQRAAAKGHVGAKQKLG